MLPSRFLINLDIYNIIEYPKEDLPVAFLSSSTIELAIYERVSWTSLPIQSNFSNIRGPPPAYS